MKNSTLSLIIPLFNEETTIENCVEKVLKIRENQNYNLEIVIVDDCSTDKSAEKLKEISAKYPEIKILTHEKNRGKGAALRTGFTHATGDFIGIQDADEEYNPTEYFKLLETLIENKADVVYGSRYLKPDTRRALHFWHTNINKFLTIVSNMFTDLDLTDIHTCYILFRSEIIKKIAPLLKEERFAFNPEVTAKVAEAGFRVYECAISYNPRTYEEGKKIGWKDGISALYCVFHYSAHIAPLPVQILLYLFIGGLSAIANMTVFAIMFYCLQIQIGISIISAFISAAIVNYILCISILFRHKARWNTLGEIVMYVLSVSFMFLIDYGITFGFMKMSLSAFWAKFLAACSGFIINFALRKWLIFPEKRTVQK